MKESTDLHGSMLTKGVYRQISKTTIKINNTQIKPKTINNSEVQGIGKTTGTQINVIETSKTGLKLGTKTIKINKEPITSIQDKINSNKT